MPKRPVAPDESADNTKILKVHIERMPVHSPDLRKLLAFGIPPIVVEVILLLLLHPAITMWEAIDAAEIFAGVASITAGIRKRGLVCVPFEIELSPTMDTCG